MGEKSEITESVATDFHLKSSISQKRKVGGGGGE